MSEIILEVKHTTTKAGRPMVLVTTDVSTHWITTSQWLNKGYSMNIDSYPGGSFDAAYYQKGEKLLNGAVYEERNGARILKDFNASQNAEVVGQAEAARISIIEKEAKLKAAKYRMLQSRNTPTGSGSNPVIEQTTEQTDAAKQAEVDKLAALKAELDAQKNETVNQAVPDLES